MEEAAKQFFSFPSFALVGASQDTNKAGYKILAWYHTHSLPVTPINPRAEPISLPSKTYKVTNTVSGLENPSHTAVSITTPPAATKKTLEEAKKAGIKAVWLQPGSFDEEGMDFAKQEFEIVVGGTEAGSQGPMGWCVMADGERCLKDLGREWKQQEL